MKKIVLEKFSFGIFTICTLIFLFTYSLTVILQSGNFILNPNPFLELKNRLNKSMKLGSGSGTRNSSELGNVYLSRNPYAFDKSCKNFSKRLFEPGTLDIVPLVSYPGSGNTWIRHLIELATGIYTGSIYMDIDILAKGFLGEKENWNSGSTIVQKMHVNYSKELNVHKAILLIRNPYDSIWSFVQYQSSGHTGKAFIGKSKLKSPEWSNYALGQTYKWISLYKSWIESQTHLLIIYYEELVAHPINELRRICNFVNSECRHLNSTCFHNHKEGSFHRRKQKSSLLVKPNYETWVAEKIDAGINYLNNLLLFNGQPGIPIANYKPNQNTNTSTQESKTTNKTMEVANEALD